MKNFKIIFFVFLFNSTLSAINVRLLNNRNEILSKNTARLLVRLDENEVLHRDNMLFSVDYPSAFVCNYKISIEPEDLYIHSFRQNKKVYSKTFTIDLKLQGFSKDFDQDASVVFQCLIFDSEKEKTDTKILKLDLIKAIKNVSLGNKFVSNSGSLAKGKLFNFFVAKKLFKQNIEFKAGVQSLVNQVAAIFKFIPDFFFFGNYLLLLLSLCFSIISCCYIANSEKRSISKLFLGFCFGILSLPFIVKFLILNIF